MNHIPYIDPNVKHVGVSVLRQMNTRALRALRDLLVIQDNGQPVAILLPYETFTLMQEALRDSGNKIAGYPWTGNEP